MLTLKKHIKRVAFVATFLLFLSCGAEEAAVEDKVSGLSGTWTGLNTVAKNGTFLTDSKASLSLEKGQFSYRNDRDEAADGTYDIIGESHIEFIASRSTTPIFPKGVSLLMELEIKAKSIVIHNNKYKLVLEKVSDSAGGDQDTPPGEAFTSSSCKMPYQGGAWVFSFSGSKKFNLAIGSSGFASGSLSFPDSSDTALLKVEKTSVTGLANKKVTATNVDDYTFEISVFESNGTPLLTRECRKLF